MAELDAMTLAAVARVRAALGAPQLTAEFAGLYSNHVRLRSGQPGLRGFGADQLSGRMRDAMRLIDAALVGRSDDAQDWRESMRRAGEILEWLAHPETNPEGLPLTVLSAATYHLAGYPARASALAGQSPEDEQSAPMIRALLASDFRRLLPLAASVAGDPAPVGDITDGAVADPGATQAYDLMARQVAASLGVLSANARWGDEQRVERALEKLRVAAGAAAYFGDSYLWLSLKLVAEVAAEAVANGLRPQLAPLAGQLSSEGNRALERYARLAFNRGETQVWPSQARGLRRLAAGDSFALCTPTGSGKTRVAEVALLQALFSDSSRDDVRPLCAYIVPSRALAAEVERRLSRVLRAAGGGGQAISISGLYGGTDWGPGDTLLDPSRPAVLVCTQEKAEALVRFLGSELLSRLSLVVLDEAHEVQHVADEDDELIKSESRALRLESLVSRLVARLPDARFIAMSAVARGFEAALASWVTVGRDERAVISRYRSTRQIVGRLECAGGRTRIEYDVLDGAPLRVARSNIELPFVPRPFPDLPAAEGFDGPRKGMAPYALWAAVHLAGEPDSDAGQTVLVSVVERPDWFASWFVSLLKAWEGSLPIFFAAPAGEDEEIYTRALEACEDYFGVESPEYQLLERGIVVHHGRMPGRLPRLLVQLVERGISRIVLATSTLTQGVNLPFETVLVPGVFRQRGGRMSTQEFANLCGRSGRPGVSSEGQTLVVTLGDINPRARVQHLADYRAILNGMTGGTLEVARAQSPLAALLRILNERLVDRDRDHWLETVAPDDKDLEDLAARPLDALDGILLAALEEYGDEADVEEYLGTLWAATFAHRAAAEEAELEQIFRLRGRVVARWINRDKAQSSRLYRTGLPPTEAVSAAAIATPLIAHLATATDWLSWDAADRVEYVEGAVDLVGRVRRFEPRATFAGNARIPWRTALRWWLGYPEVERRPSPTGVGQWHDFIQREFAFKFSWGLGAVLATAVDPPAERATPETWFLGTLPYAAIWLKDLVQWGVLDPAEAYALARGYARTRPEAALLAGEFHSALGSLETDLDPLDPEVIRAWFDPTPEESARPRARRYDVDLTEAAEGATKRRWRVLPVVDAQRIRWLDPSGFLMATSARTAGAARPARQRDYWLDIKNRRVTSQVYV
jgi:hypothetical protein